MNSLAFFSLKGGTGKTTLSGSLGWMLAEQGRNVLMIDMDPQGHLTHLLRIKPAQGRTSLFDVLIHEQPLSQAVVPTAYPGLSLIPATAGHLRLNSALFSKPWREWRLKDALYALVPLPYDLILLDVGANLNLLTFNALFASRTLIIPTLPDPFSYISLKTQFAFLKEAGKEFHYSFQMIWVLINQINNHRPSARAGREALKKYYGRFLLPVAIREDPKCLPAAQEQIPLPLYAAQSAATRDLNKLAGILDDLIFHSKPLKNPVGGQP